MSWNQTGEVAISHVHCSVSPDLTEQIQRAGLGIRIQSLGFSTISSRGTRREMAKAQLQLMRPLQSDVVCLELVNASAQIVVVRLFLSAPVRPVASTYEIIEESGGLGYGPLFRRRLLRRFLQQQKSHEGSGEEHNGQCIRRRSSKHRLVGRGPRFQRQRLEPDW